MRAMAHEEYESLKGQLSEALDTAFPKLLVPASADTSRLSAYIELNAGVGGDEASLFLGDLMNMYLRLSEVLSWAATVVSSNETDSGGVKNAILEVRGEKAYDTLRWESGVHRVQRVPATETRGRTHTSTVAAVVCIRYHNWNPYGVKLILIRSYLYQRMKRLLKRATSYIQWPT